MKIELVFDDEGNLMITNEKGETEYHFCEYDIPEELKEMLKKIPKYKPFSD
jgi:hypothetical protein